MKGPLFAWWLEPELWTLWPEARATRGFLTPGPRFDPARARLARAESESRKPIWIEHQGRAANSSIPSGCFLTISMVNSDTCPLNLAVVKTWLSRRSFVTVLFIFSTSLPLAHGIQGYSTYLKQSSLGGRSKTQPKWSKMKNVQDQVCGDNRATVKKVCRIAYCNQYASQSALR